MIERNRDVSHHDDELLSAFMDGELDAARHAALERRLEQEPELAHRLDALRAVDTRLRDAFGPSEAEPLPERLRELIAAADENGNQRTPGQGAKVINLPRIAARLRSWAPLAAAASVALVVGLLAGRGPIPGGEGDPGMLAGQSPLTPGSVLYEVVASMPSGQSQTLPDRSVVTPEYTFRTAGGNVCRRLAVSGTEGVTTVVTCRSAGDWRVQLARFTPGEAATYSPAFGRPDPFEHAVEALIAGAPLNAEAERAALAGNASD